MTGPNHSNWLKLVKSCNEPILDEIFLILSRKDIREDSSSSSLYLSLYPESFSGILTYMDEGKLSIDDIDEVIGSVNNIDFDNNNSQL